MQQLLILLSQVLILLLKQSLIPMILKRSPASRYFDCHSRNQPTEAKSTIETIQCVFSYLHHLTSKDNTTAISTDKRVFFMVMYFYFFLCFCTINIVVIDIRTSTNAKKMYGSLFLPVAMEPFALLEEV